MRYLQYELLSTNHSGKLVYYLKTNSCQQLPAPTTNGPTDIWLTIKTIKTHQSDSTVFEANNITGTWQTSNNIASSLTNQDNDQRLITSTEDAQFTWLWWWLPLRLSERHSMSLQTVLLRTTLTRTIVIYRLMKAIISALSSLGHHIHKLMC